MNNFLVSNRPDSWLGYLLLYNIYKSIRWRVIEEAWTSGFHRKHLGTLAYTEGRQKGEEERRGEEMGRGHRKEGEGNECISNTYCPF